MANTPSSPRVPSPFKEVNIDEERAREERARTAANEPIPPNDPEYLTMDYAREVELSARDPEAPAETPTAPNPLTQTQRGYAILEQPSWDVDDATAAQSPSQNYQERPASIPPAEKKLSLSDKILKYVTLGTVALAGGALLTAGSIYLSRGCDNNNGSNSGYSIGSGCNGVISSVISDSGSDGGLDAAVSAADGDADTDSDVDSDSDADGSYDSSAVPAPVSDGDGNGDGNLTSDTAVIGDGDLDERVGDGDVSGDGGVSPAPAPVVTPTPTPAPTPVTPSVYTGEQNGQVVRRPQVTYASVARNFVDDMTRVRNDLMGQDTLNVTIDEHTFSFRPENIPQELRTQLDCYFNFLVGEVNADGSFDRGTYSPVEDNETIFAGNGTGVMQHLVLAMAYAALGHDSVVRVGLAPGEIPDETAHVVLKCLGTDFRGLTFNELYDRVDEELEHRARDGMLPPVYRRTNRRDEARMTLNGNCRESDCSEYTEEVLPRR